MIEAIKQTPLRRIPFCKVQCDALELNGVKEVLESGWLTTAGKAFLFEKEFAQIVQSRFALAVNSCTSALHLGLEALGVGPGQKVFVPTMTFTASAEVIRYLGADPVFLDVEYGTSLVTPEILRRAIERNPDVKTLVVVHFGGQSAAMLDANGNGLVDICREHGIRILEDAAHAFPTRCGNRMIGSIGDITCFSFYANKTITTGEGGMLTTDDETIAKRVKLMRLHGINRDAWDRFTSDKPSWEYDVVAPGYKYNMPDVNAAIGLAQLKKASAMRLQRQQRAVMYRNCLEGLKSIDLPVCNAPDNDHSWHLFPIVVKPDAPIGRNRLIEILSERGIGTSVHYRPLHRMAYYRDFYKLRSEDFPNAERIWNGTVSLPLYPSLTDDDLNFVCETLWDVLG